MQCFSGITRMRPFFFYNQDMNNYLLFHSVHIFLDEFKFKIISTSIHTEFKLNKIKNYMISVGYNILNKIFYF